MSDEFFGVDAIRASEKNSMDAPEVRLCLSHQKLPAFHHLFAVEPDIEIAADAVDVRFRNPVRASVLGIGMTEGDVNARNFFILQNVADDVRTGGVGAARKFADPIAVFICAGVSAKFVAQVFILARQRPDAVVFYFDRERIGFEIAETLAQIITDYAINHEHALGVHRRSKNFATGKIAPFVARDDAAGL